MGLVQPPTRYKPTRWIDSDSLDSPKVGPSDFALLRVVNEGCRTPVPWSQVIENSDYYTVDVSEIRGVNHRLDV